MSSRIIVRRGRPVAGLAAGVLASLLVLAACGSDDSDGEAAPVTSNADAPDEAPSDAGTHTVDHARGETAVPDEPERVVVLEPVALDTAVALDVIPVGTTVLSEDTGVPAYLGDDAAEIESVGTVPEPNLERIAELQPDLIIGTETRHSDLYDKLTEVAPTVYMPSQADPWQDNVDVVARALGAEAEAEQLLAEYQARCQELAEKHGTEGQTAQLIRPRDDLFTLYGPTSFAGSTLECAGFTTPEHDWEDISLDISPERVLGVSADLVLVTTTDVTDESTVPPTIRNNIERFPNLHLVDRAFWITGVGPLGGMTVLDDLDQILAGTREGTALSR